MVTVLLATADDDGEMPEGKRVPPRARRRPGDSGIEELIMELDARRDGRATGAVAGRLSPTRRSAARRRRCASRSQDVKRKSLPELDDAFAREVGDFESLDALHDSGARGSRATRRARGGRRGAPAAHRPDHRREPVRRAAELGEPAGRRLHRGVPGSRGGARAVRRASSAPMAERQVRRDLVIDTIAEQREARRRREADIDDRVAEVGEEAQRRSGPGLRVAPEGGPAAGDRARASPRRRCSSGCWSGTRLTRSNA